MRNNGKLGTHAIILYYRIVKYGVHEQFVLKLFIRNTEFYLRELYIYSKIEHDKYETNSIGLSKLLKDAIESSLFRQ